MSFEMIELVDYLEEADFVEKFSAGDTGEPVTEEYALRLLSATAKFYLENKIVQAALLEVEKFQQKQDLVGHEPFPEPWKKSVVICGRIERFLYPGTKMLPWMYSTAHTAMEKKVIVLQLKDYGPIAKCSFAPSRDGVPMDPKFVAERELRVKLNFESLQGIMYQRNSHVVRRLAES